MAEDIEDYEEEECYECELPPRKSSLSKELAKLEKYFDEVKIDDKKDYRLLTIQDKAGKPNYDYVVWLQLKVSYGHSNIRYNNHDSDYMLSNIVELIVTWVDLLLKFKKEEKPKVLSLFGEVQSDEDKSELEPEPKESEFKSYDSYHNKLEKVKRANLMKQYSFFELCDFSYYTYSGIDHRPLLPDNNQLIEMLKEAIVKGKGKSLRENSFWYDDEYEYLTRDGALSDYEIYHRVKFMVRLFLVPYKREFYVNTDLSYQASIHEPEINYRFWFINGRLEYYGSADSDKAISEDYYSVNQPEFISWLRELYNIEYRDALDDEVVLKENILRYFQRCLGDDFESRYDFHKKIKSFSTWKLFKSDFNAFMKEHHSDHNGSGSGYSIDGFHASLDYDKKGRIKILMSEERRVEIDRDIDLPIDDFSGDLAVYDLKGDDIFQKAFSLFNKDTLDAKNSENEIQVPKEKQVVNTKTQMSLFDYLAA